MIPNDGLILLSKKEGMTSFQCLGPLKKKLKKKKIGHTGTLDKFASGLLLVLTGPFTRFVPYFHQFPKKYTALVKMGEETATLDPEGEVVQRSEMPAYNLLQEVLSRFQGKIKQVPPVYSAVHSNGKRAYQLALEGKDPGLKARNIEIHDIRLYDYNPPFFSLDVHCSTGTYIRSLARDICRAAGSCGHLVQLKRTSIGPFDIENACLSDEISEKDVLGFETFIPELSDLKPLCLKSEYINKVLNGFPLTDQFFDDQNITSGRYYFYSKGMFLVVCEKNHEKWKYHMVLRFS